MKKINYMLNNHLGRAGLREPLSGFCQAGNGCLKSADRAGILSVPGLVAMTVKLGFLLLLLAALPFAASAATQNSGDQQYANNADGFSVAGGTTTVRTLTVTGGDVTLTGGVGGGNTYNFPTPYSGTTATLVGVDETQTLTHKTWNGETITVPYGGTGAVTLTGILLGNGTSAVTGITTSAGISGALSDETGSGVLVFGTAPTFTTSIITPLIIGGTSTTSTLILRPTSGVGTTGADIIFQNGNNGGTERLRIMNNGNVGIGTSGPRGLLEVDASPYTAPFIVTTGLNVGIGSSAPQQRLDVEGSVYVGSSGNIGIGTSTPAAGLQVGTGSSSLSATLDGTAALIRGNLEVDGKIYGDGSQLTNLPGAVSGLTANYIAKAASATALANSQLYDNGTNIGIGSTSPQQKLDVEGTVYFGSGNVGIGSAAPTAILDVNGIIYGHSNVGIGTWVPLANLDIRQSSGAPLIRIGEAASNHGLSIGYDVASHYGEIWARDFTGGNWPLVLQPYGNVGIGTNAPTAVLEVNGTIYGHNNVGIGTSAARALLDVDGAAYFRGNIGIGTIASSSILEIRKDQDATTEVRVMNTDYANSRRHTQLSFYLPGSGTPLRAFIGNDNNSDIFSLGSNVASTGKVAIYSGGSERVRLAADGNVGLGSTIPRQKLDVEGTIYVGSNGNIGIGTASPAAGLQVGSGASALSATLDGSAALIRGNLEVDGKIYGDGSLLTGVVGAVSGLTANYLPKAGSATTLTNSQILDNGTNVGIGSATPQAKLDVEGTVYFGTGNVGVGTASPYTKLQVVDTSSVSPRGILSTQISSDTSGARVGFSKARGVPGTLTTIVTGDTIGRLMFRGYDGSNYLEMASIEAVSTGTVASTRVPTYMAFSTGTDAAPSVLTERMRIDAAGNVGIGSTSPQQTLDVEGTVYFGTGNVGINSAAPTALLDVNGTIYGHTNVGIGTSAARQLLDVEGSIYVRNNIGIGTLSPGYKLSIFDGSLDFSASNYTNAFINRVYGIRFNWSNDQSYGRGWNHGIYSTSTSGSAATDIRIGSYNNVSIVLDDNSNDATSYLYVGHHAGGNASFGTPLFVVQSPSGNVGIGSATPRAKLDVDGTAYFGSGNVGIGTHAPQQRLDVEGTVYFGNGNVGIGTATPLGSVEIQRAGSVHPLLVSSSVSGDYLMVSSSGNVGIGSTTPNVKLYVNGSAIIKGSSTAGTEGEIVYDTGGHYYKYYNGTTWEQFVGGSVTYSGTLWDQNGTTIYYGSGNVGIGTTAPGQLLDLWQMEDSNGLRVRGFDDQTGSYGDIAITSAGDMRYWSNSEMVFSISGSTSFIVDATRFTHYMNMRLDDNIVVSAGIDSDYSLGYNSADDTFRIGDGANLTSNPRVVMDANGNVGLGGETSPDGTFEVASVTGRAPLMISSGASGDGNLLVVTSSGNVGIGTATASRKTEIVGGTSASEVVLLQLRSNYTAANTGSTIKFINSSSGSANNGSGEIAVIRTLTNAGDMIFRVATDSPAMVERLRIASTGNIGIGSSSPQQALDVEGTVYFGSGNVGIGTAAPVGALDINRKFVVLNGSIGNVGIGSVSPQQKLDVEGSIYVGSSGNIGIGTASPAAGLQIGTGSSALSATLDGTAALIRGNLEVDGKIYGDGSLLTGVVGAVSGLTTSYLPRAGSSTSLVNSQIYDNGTNVGIGSATPQAKLDVEGTVYFGTGNVGIGTSAPDRRLVVQLLDAAGVDEFKILDSAGATVFTIDSDGNTLWNNNMPTVNFNNASTIGFNDIDISDPGVGEGIGWTGTSAGWVIDVSPFDRSNVDGNLNLYGTANNIVLWRPQIWLYDASNYTTATAQSSGGLLFTTTGTGHIAFNPGGNVGIGSASPQQKLDVEGTVYVGSGGNVGIGTAAPVAGLQIGSGTSALSATLSGTGALIKGNLEVDGKIYGDGSLLTGLSGTISGLTTNYLSRAASSTSIANSQIIDNGTNVGIGSTTPEAKLDVDGTVYLHGNVGIGTTSNSALLNLAQGATAASGINFGGDTNLYRLSAGTLVTDSNFTASTFWAMSNGVIPVLYGGITSGGGLILDSTAHASKGSIVIAPSGGNVGIASASPQQKLDVEGSIYVGSGGNIGIGTASPRAGLQVGTGTSALGATLDGTAALIKGNLEVDGKIYGDGSGLTGVTTSATPGGVNSNIQFNNSGALGGSNQFVFDGTNVGIGTTVPSTPLHVKAAGANDYDLVPVMTLESNALTMWYTDTYSSTNWASPFWRARRARGTSASPTTIVGGDALARWSGYGYDGASYQEAALIRMEVSSARTSGMPGAIRFYTTPDASTTVAERMVINYNGNVGIGSSSPQALLDVEGTAYFGTGNVGIGTAAPVGLLDVNRKLTVLSGGYVGVNSASPTAALEVMYNVSAGDVPFRVSGSALGDVMVITNPGNVGIGALSPVAKLQVDGAIYAAAGALPSHAGVSLGTAGDAMFGGDVEIDGALYVDSGIYFTGTISGNGSGLTGITATVVPAGADTHVQYNNAGAMGGSNLFVFNGVNVGIGSSSPQARLDVEGNVYLGSGSVGIGTPSGGAKLQIRNVNGGSAILYLENSSTSDVSVFYDWGGSLNYFYGDTETLVDYTTGTITTGNMIRALQNSSAFSGTGLLMNFANGSGSFTGKFIDLQKDSVSQFVVMNNGNVGIGSSTPQQKLDVEGTVYFGTGNVGIGVATPNSRLQLNGSFAVYRTSSTGGTTAGQVIIGVDSSGGAHTITLATADCVNGRIMIIKDESGNAATNNITIATQGSEAIDGTTNDNSVLITSNYGVIRVYSNGTDWFTF